jgi:hypothetical protein
MSFLKDLQRGKEVEDRIVSLGKRLGYKAVPVDGKFAGYDFFIADTKKAYEVKYDPMSQKTGNIVIEVSMFGKRSGLMSTIADLWIIDTSKEMITISPDQIKNCIVETNPRLSQFVGKGDEEPKKAYLIKIDTLKRYAEKVINSF